MIFVFYCLLEDHLWGVIIELSGYMIFLSIGMHKSKSISFFWLDLKLNTSNCKKIILNQVVIKSR